MKKLIFFISAMSCILFCVSETNKSQIIDTYIHCDWGWGGYCNGYYSGAVFEASIYKFASKNYFAVKREYGGSLTPEFSLSPL